MLLLGPDLCHGDALAGLDAVTPEVVHSIIYMLGITIVIVIIIILRLLYYYILYVITLYVDIIISKLLSLLVIIGSQSFTLNP